MSKKKSFLSRLKNTLTEQVSFWTGSLLTLLIIFPLYLFEVESLAERTFKDAAQAVTLFLGAVAGFVIIFFLRHWILKKTLGTTKASIQELAEELGSLVSAAADKDLDEVKRKSTDTARAAIAWYSWTNFYRWVFNMLLAILVATAGFAGTLLLFEQTQVFKQQLLANNIQASMDALSLTDTIRDKLTKHSTEINDDKYRINLINTGYLENVYDTGSGRYLISSRTGIEILSTKSLKSTTNSSVIKSLSSFAASKEVEGILVKSLIHLLDDENSSVVAGALQVLSSKGYDLSLSDKVIEISDVYGILNLGRVSNATLKFDNFVGILSCVDCTNIRIRVENSFLRLYLSNTFVQGISLGEGHLHIAQWENSELRGLSYGNGLFSKDESINLPKHFKTAINSSFTKEVTNTFCNSSKKPELNQRLDLKCFNKLNELIKPKP